MTKNAVQRLQKINRQLKSVLSVYDAVDSAGYYEWDSKETGLISDERKTLWRNESDNLINSKPKTEEKNSLASKELFEGRKKKCTCMGSKTENDFQCSELSVWTTSRRNNTWLLVKPGSAPSYTNSLTGQYESDSILHPSQSTNACNKTITKKNIFNAQTNELFQLQNLNDEKITAKAQKGIKQISGKNSIFQNKEILENDQLCDMISNESSENNGNSDVNIKMAGGKNLKENSKCKRMLETAQSFRSRSEFPQKNFMCDPPGLDPLKQPVTSKNEFEANKELLKLKGVQFVPDITKKITRLDKKNCLWPRADSRDKKNKHESTGEANIFKNNKKQENAINEKTNKKISNSKIREKRDANQKRKSIDEKSENFEEREIEQKNWNQKEKSPKVNQYERLENSKFEAQELSKIIEKSNVKLEKMKLSKNLAIDIAKQLRNKYEEIKNSKNKLIDRLQEVEKDNERLNYEVEKQKNSKITLQKSIEIIKTKSKTELFEHEAKTQEILNENVCLRTKLNEMEKEHFKNLIKNQKEIDEPIKQKFLDKSTEYQQFQQDIINNPCKHVDALQEEISTSEDLRVEKKGKKPEANEEFRETEVIRKLMFENSQLLLKVEELGNMLSDRQYQIDSLEDKMKELECELKRQKHHLKQKTDKLEDTNKELESIRQNSKDLEEQVKSLRQNIEYFDAMHQNVIGKSDQNENQIKKLQEQIEKLETDKENLRKDLENEKDSLLIKNKIIDDQQETIKQLREKSEESKTLMKKNQSLERMINIERDEKIELQNAIEHLKCRKEELKKKIKLLEGDLLLAPQEVVRDLQKTQLVLHELENQVQLKQKEWEFHLQSLIKEKEQACTVAEFATKKLIQTTNEFQKQSEAHKRLNKVLAENLAEKERRLKELNEKVGSISQTQFKEMATKTDMGKKRFFKPAFSETYETHLPLQDLTHRTYGTIFATPTLYCDNEERKNILHHFH